MKQKKKKSFEIGGTGFVLLASVLWGTTGTAQAFAPAGAKPLAIGAVRILIGGISLLLFAFWKDALPNIKNWPLKKVILASLSMTLYQPCFFTGVALTGVAVGTIVGIGSSPIFAGILSSLIYKDKPGKSWYIATFLSILGNFILIISGDKISLHLPGIVFALGAGLAYASYTVHSKELLKLYQEESVLAVLFTFGAVFLTPALFLMDFNWLFEPNGILVSVHLGIITVAFAYYLFSRGLSQISAANAVSLTLAEPLTATFLGIFLLGEKLNLLSAFGLFLILSGLVQISKEV